MNEYEIEQRIKTLVDCAVTRDNYKSVSFTIDNIKFTQYNYKNRGVWDTHEWVATSTISAKDFYFAFNKFIQILKSVIPKISFISQAYIEYRLEPYLIHKIGNKKAFVQYIKKTNPIALMFTNQNKEILMELMNKQIPPAFFLYWRDAVNTTGYTSKLLLMFSAIEALTDNNKDKYKLRDRIFGKDLKKELFGIKGNSGNALRNRLTHGEYFNENDTMNYFKIIHKKVINYINNEILSKYNINEKIVNPHRHFFGNRKLWKGFIERYDEKNNYNLKNVLEKFENNGGKNQLVYKTLTADKQKFYDKNY